MQPTGAASSGAKPATSGETANSDFLKVVATNKFPRILRETSEGDIIETRKLATGDKERRELIAEVRVLLLSA